VRTAAPMREREEAVLGGAHRRCALQSSTRSKLG
jgi:hypothetical protein